MIRRFVFGATAAAVALFSEGCCHPFRSGLALEPDRFPDGKVGGAYDATFTVRNADTPVGGVKVVDGRLPPGLELYHERYEPKFSVSGKPEAAGEFRFSLSLFTYGTMCAGKSLVRPFVLRVGP